jgi:hypothetical protein
MWTRWIRIRIRNTALVNNFFAFAEIVDRELNDEELDKVGSKEAIRRELASRIADAVTEEEEMKRTSNTSSGQEGTRTKAEDHILHFFLPLDSFINLR